MSKVLYAIAQARLLIKAAERNLLVLVAYKRALDGNDRRFAFTSNLGKAWFTARIEKGQLIIDYSLKGNNYLTQDACLIEQRIRLDPTIEAAFMMIERYDA